MDPVLRTTLVIFAAVTIKTLILAWWDSYKARKALEPIPMKERNGVFVPWGTVQRIQRIGWRFTQVWLVYIAALLLLLAWVKLVGPVNAWGLLLS